MQSLSHDVLLGVLTALVAGARASGYGSCVPNIGDLEAALLPQ